MSEKHLNWLKEQKQKIHEAYYYYRYHLLVSVIQDFDIKIKEVEDDIGRKKYASHLNEV